MKKYEKLINAALREPDKQADRWHPSLEQIAGLIDKSLEPKQEERVKEHLAECNECFLIFSESVKDMSRDSFILKLRRNKHKIIATAALLCVAFISIFVITRVWIVHETEIGEDSPYFLTNGNMIKNSVLLPMKGELKGYYSNYRGELVTDREQIEKILSVLSEQGVRTNRQINGISFLIPASPNTEGLSGKIRIFQRDDIIYIIPK